MVLMMNVLIGKLAELFYINHTSQLSEVRKHPLEQGTVSRGQIPDHKGLTNVKKNENIKKYIIIIIVKVS